MITNSPACATNTQPSLHIMSSASVPCGAKVYLAKKKLQYSSLYFTVNQLMKQQISLWHFHTFLVGIDLPPIPLPTISISIHPHLYPSTPGYPTLLSYYVYPMTQQFHSQAQTQRTISYYRDTCMLMFIAAVFTKQGNGFSLEAHQQMNG